MEAPSRKAPAESRCSLFTPAPRSSAAARWPSEWLGSHQPSLSRLSSNWAPTSRSARRPRFLLFNQRPIGRVAAVERQRCEHRPHPRLRGRRRAPARGFTTSGFGVFRRCNLQTTVPKSFPMPAVRAIANAPQNVTRAVARRTFAPPAFPRSRPEGRESPRTQRTRWGQAQWRAIRRPSARAWPRRQKTLRPMSVRLAPGARW